MNSLSYYRQPDLVKWLMNMQEKLHTPPTLGRSPGDGGLELCVTIGSHDAICKVGYFYQPFHMEF